MNLGEIWGCAPRARSALPGADASPGAIGSKEYVPILLVGPCPWKTSKRQAATFTDVL